MELNRSIEICKKVCRIRFHSEFLFRVSFIDLLVIRLFSGLNRLYRYQKFHVILSFRLSFFFFLFFSFLFISEIEQFSIDTCCSFF